MSYCTHCGDNHGYSAKKCYEVPGAFSRRRGDVSRGINEVKEIAMFKPNPSQKWYEKAIKCEGDHDIYVGPVASDSEICTKPDVSEPQRPSLQDAGEVSYNQSMEISMAVTKEESKIRFT